jgi:hypothetical protein
MAKKFPSDDDLRRLERAFHWPDMEGVVVGMLPKREQHYTTAMIETLHNVKQWERHLTQRLRDLRYAYLMMTFYSRQGVIDTVVVQSGMGAVREEPIRTPEQQWTADRFHFYAEDVLTRYKSILDTVAHILSAYYGMGIEIKKVSFTGEQFKKQLRASCEPLYNTLDTAVWQSEDFVKSNDTRNDMQHKYLPRTATTERNVRARGERGIVAAEQETVQSHRRVFGNVECALRVIQRTLVGVASHLSADWTSKTIGDNDLVIVAVQQTFSIGTVGSSPEAPARALVPMRVKPRRKR